MATDYFNMMKDVVGGYGRGLDTRRLRDKTDAEEARKATLFNQEQEQYQRKLGLQRQADAAYADQNTLATVGNVNYGGETGARGLQSAEGDYQREANRMGLSRADMPTGAGAVVATKATDRDFNNAALRVAIAKQDDTGIAAARDKDRVLRMRDVHDWVAKIPDAELPKHAAGVNTKGDLPIIYTGGGKNGFTFMTTDPDGTPGKPFTATTSQLRQLILAGKLGDEGFGPESIELAGKAHTAINDFITKMNSQTVAVNKGNNDAAFHSGEIGIGLQRNAIAAGARSDANEARERENWAPIGASEDDKGLLFLNRQTGRTEVRPLPAGTSAKDLFAKLTGKKGSSEDGFTKVPEDGSKVRDSRGNVFTYSDGEPIMRGGIAPKERPTVMKKLNLPAQAETLLKWEPGGRYVTVPDDNDTLYDLVNEPDLVRKALDRVIVSTQAAGEMQRRGGFTPRYQAGPEAVMRSNANELARLRAARGLPL